MAEELAVMRISDAELFRRARDDPIWHCCRNCNAEIAPSAPEHAYCDVDCKRTSMAKEMGFGPGGS